MFYSVKLAIKNIMYKKARTVFIAISIAIGITSVLVISMISGLGKSVMNNELDSLGINGIMISAKDEKGSSVLNCDDLDLISSHPQVKSATPIFISTGYIKTSENYNPVIIWGIDSGAEGIISFKLTSGENITKSNVENKEFYCLVDEKSGNKIGDTVRLVHEKKNYNAVIIGTVTVDSGLMKSLAGDYIPPIIYMPYTTVQAMENKEELSQIAVKLDETSSQSTDVISKNLERLIYNSKDKSNYKISTQNLVHQRNKLNGLMDTITLALSAIGTISLIVSGLSIMIIMMMAVNERTKEIGIKRAIGANKSSVIGELLTETVIICVIGGVVGILFSKSISLVAQNFGFQINLSASQVLFTILLTVIGGLIFGLYPAIIAARLNPVDALRKE